MSVKIYAQEILDGVSAAVASQASIAYTSEVTVGQDLHHDIASLIEKDQLALANSNPGQEDLFYLRSILVSTAWNLNDDVFTPDWLWKARKTPEDKQFNLMHNESDIIGHITSNQVADFDNNFLSDDLTQPPAEFNIITNAVIYKSWSNPEQRNRIEKLIAEIQEGKWFVSMECIFPDFDYALKNAAGEISIVERGEASAFLTKHLRTYGGTGEFQDYKIGRVLKNLIFSGKGLVDKPANPRSVILQEQQAISYAKKQEIADMTVEKENEQLKSQLVEVKAELLESKSTIVDLTKIGAEVEALRAEIAANKDAVANLAAEKQTLEDTVATLTASLEAAEKAKSELDSKVKEIEAKAKTEMRKAQLVEAGLEAEELDDALASFNAVDDTAFEKMVAVMKKKGKKQDFVPFKKKDEEEDDSAANVLDTAEPEESSANVTETEEEDQVAKLRTDAVNFFSKTLASTKK